MEFLDVMSLRALCIGLAHLRRRDSTAATDSARLLEQRVYSGQYVDRAGRNADHFYAVVAVEIGFVRIDADDARLAAREGVRKLLA